MKAVQHRETGDEVQAGIATKAETGLLRKRKQGGQEGRNRTAAKAEIGWPD